MKPLRLALLSLSRRKIPTTITVVSIAISVACAGILLRIYHLSASRFDSLGRGWEAVVGAKAGGIEILLGSLNGEGTYPDFLPYALFESLRAGRSVRFEDGAASQPSYLKSITPFLYFAKVNSGYRVAGTDETFVEMYAPMRDGHWIVNPEDAVLGSAVAAREGWHVGDNFKAESWIFERSGDVIIPLKVSGILRPTDSAFDRMIFTSVARAQETVARDRAAWNERSIWGEKVLSYFLIVLHPGGFTHLQNLVNKRTVGQAIRVIDEKQKLEELTGAGKSIGLFVSVFVILLSSLSVSAMLITRFEAMSLQLAVLRAIGYGRAEIGRWLIWEGLLLGLAGCVIGALIDAGGFPVLRELLGSALPPLDVSASTLWESFPVWLVTIPATTAAIFIPLIRLYRQDVHQALKS